MQLHLRVPRSRLNSGAFAQQGKTALPGGGSKAASSWSMVGTCGNNPYYSLPCQEGVNCDMKMFVGFDRQGKDSKPCNRSSVSHAAWCTPVNRIALYLQTASDLKS